VLIAPAPMDLDIVAWSDSPFVVSSPRLGAGNRRGSGPIMAAVVQTGFSSPLVPLPSEHVTCTILDVGVLSIGAHCSGGVHPAPESVPSSSAGVVVVTAVRQGTSERFSCLVRILAFGAKTSRLALAGFGIPRAGEVRRLQQLVVWRGHPEGDSEVSCVWYRA